MRRLLLRKGNSKSWDILLQDTSVSIKENNKTYNKEFKSNEEALDYTQKKQWKLLKKGCIYHNENVEQLDPVLHVYIGSGYTGYMPIAPLKSTNSAYITYVLGEFDQENIYKIDELGNKELIIEIPPPSLTFEMVYLDKFEKLYINANHNILIVDPLTKILSRLSSEKDQNISVFSTANNRIVWVDGLMLRVTDIKENLVIWQHKLNIKQHEAHAHEICAALSKDGTRLAYSSIGNDNITYINLTNNEKKEIKKRKISTTMKIFFSSDNSKIFIQEKADSWQMKYYNINIDEGWRRLSDMGEDIVLESSIDAEHQKLAVCTRGWVKVYDMDSIEQLFCFKPENIITYCNAAFLKDYIAIYTDHGCYSLYKL